MSCNFDNVICRYPLPGDVPEFLKNSPVFQTSDLGGGMGDYEITESGEVRPVFDQVTVEICRRLGLDVVAPLQWKRKRLEIYASNICGGKPMPDGSYKHLTRNGEEPLWITYVVQIRNSVVSSIKELRRS